MNTCLSLVKIKPASSVKTVRELFSGYQKSFPLLFEAPVTEQVLPALESPDCLKLCRPIDFSIKMQYNLVKIVVPYIY